MSENRTHVLFVCLGNICRSPLAEGAFRYHAETAGIEGQFVIDSAGIGSWHEGEKPDGRSIDVALRNGIDISSQRARQIKMNDFFEFDYIIAMDETNLSNLKEMKPMDSEARIQLLLDDPSVNVPDPYYGGPDGFSKVFKMVYEGTQSLLDDVQGQSVSA